MPDCFEVLHKDLAGRIGRLVTPHGALETPALMPVINPHLQVIKPAELKEMGASILITNSYIISQDELLKRRALELGLHDLLGFNGPIMTDSGAYQLSSYGDLSIDPEDILKFQLEIGSDICVPLDIPTPPDATRERALSELQETERRLVKAIEERGSSLLAGPIQGSTYPDLREAAGRSLGAMGFDIYPIGGVVPLMEAYRYRDLASVIVSSKKGLGPGFPVHLFGCGHPAVFALAAALGCDLFDSAAYALYARDGRYLTTEGTWRLEDLKHLPCSCEVCRRYSPEELMEQKDKVRLLAVHNLNLSFQEIRQIKQHIWEGTLWELLEIRSRSHPKMIDAFRSLKEHVDWIERLDRSSKSTLFYMGPESACRPEVLRYASRVERIALSGNVLITDMTKRDSGPEDLGFDHLLIFKPPFGPCPIELLETYPLNAIVPSEPDWAGVDRAILNTRRLIEANPHASFKVRLKDLPEAEAMILSEAVRS
jgi:7-cyano-7-deazaguanine tRNA-ribosyltransferase